MAGSLIGNTAVSLRGPARGTSVRAELRRPASSVEVLLPDPTIRTQPQRAVEGAPAALDGEELLVGDEVIGVSVCRLIGAERLAD